jgi:hypothetical protein
LLYRPLKWRGGPNRIRLSSYINVLKDEELEFSIFVTRLAGIKDDIPIRTSLREIDRHIFDESRSYISQVRKKLAPPFCDMEDVDLMVQGFFISAHKPPRLESLNLKPQSILR